uniref:F-box domain-containing protein n=1 Tax=Ditylenchus dipsaci TaxID=166011 RepID=A0A915EHQ6_9BILA
MAFRFYDSSVDDAALTGLFNAVHAVLRETSMTSNDTDVLALWLPIRNQLKLRVDVFYTKFNEENRRASSHSKNWSVFNFPAILQHESCEIVCNGKDAGKRYLVDLLEAGLPSNIQLDMFSGLNHMIFRKELCTPDKAISIKHNVTEIQNWLSENKLAGSEMFEPLIQASHLLQIRKNVTSTNEKDELLMRGTFLEPFNSESFLYSDFQLETLSLPTCLDFHTGTTWMTDEQACSSSIDHIPEELLVKILSKVKCKDLAQIQQVSSRLKRLIQHHSPCLSRPTIERLTIRMVNTTPQTLENFQPTFLLTVPKNL